MGLQAIDVNHDKIGWFRVFVTPPGGDKIEITTFRDAPVHVSSLATSDPFGETTCALDFPMISPFDRPGQGDLHWLVPYTLVDILWQNMPGYSYSWQWEGFVVDESVSLSEGGSSYTVECKGALYQQDNYLAKPTFPQQPVPYEHLIYDAFNPELHPGSAVQPLRIIWPNDWRTVVEETTEDKLWFLRPYGVTPGQKWSGLMTRSTGTWEPTLSTFVQSLLSVMYDESGTQWTIRNDPGRIPVLHLRNQPSITDPELLTIDLGAPGVDVQFSRDFTQSANVIYGAGKDIAGATFTGAQISDDGTSTTYEPMAYSPYVYPDEKNPLYNPHIARREVQMQFPNGMDELAARDVARAQYYRFADPGFTGTITLRSDPKQVNGTYFPRMLIKAGRSIMLRGFRGGNLLCHISSSSVDLDSAEVTLTVDTKFRDALTVHEVRARTRDALTPVRLLKPGSFTTVTQDMIRPWSYEAGSGFLPLGSQELFKKTVKDDKFPWTNLTKRYPPKKYPQYYVRIKNPDRLTVPKRNWTKAIPVRFAQQGTIRLTQIGCYDKHGNLLPVRFHVSVWNNTVGTDDMPGMPSATTKVLKPAGATYGENARTPFFQDAFEDILSSGATNSETLSLMSASGGFQMGWGNYYEPAGYSPGLASQGADKTGKLIDETPWNFDTTANGGNKWFDPALPNISWSVEGAGVLYVKIYCDDRTATYTGPVYFLGRFLRQEYTE